MQINQIPGMPLSEAVPVVTKQKLPNKPEEEGAFDLIFELTKKLVDIEQEAADRWPSGNSNQQQIDETPVVTGDDTGNSLAEVDGTPEQVLAKQIPHPPQDIPTDIQARPGQSEESLAAATMLAVAASPLEKLSQPSLIAPRLALPGQRQTVEEPSSIGTKSAIPLPPIDFQSEPRPLSTQIVNIKAEKAGLDNSSSQTKPEIIGIDGDKWAMSGPEPKFIPGREIRQSGRAAMDTVGVAQLADGTSVMARAQPISAVQSGLETKIENAGLIDSVNITREKSTQNDRDANFGTNKYVLQPGLEKVVVPTGRDTEVVSFARDKETLQPTREKETAQGNGIRISTGGEREIMPGNHERTLSGDKEKVPPAPYNNEDGNRRPVYTSASQSRTPDIASLILPGETATQAANKESEIAKELPRNSGFLAPPIGATLSAMAKTDAYLDRNAIDRGVPKTMAISGLQADLPGHPNERSTLNVESQPSSGNARVNQQIHSVDLPNRNSITSEVLPSTKPVNAMAPPNEPPVLNETPKSVLEIIPAIQQKLVSEQPRRLIPETVGRNSIRTSVTPASPWIRIPETASAVSFLPANGEQPALNFELVESEHIVAPLAEQNLQTGNLRSTDALPVRPQAARMIASQMADAMFRAQSNKVEISLNPEELGRVRMVLTTTDIGVSVAIVAERPETLDLMRRHIDQLAEEFRNLGYDNIGFEFAERESNGQRADNPSRSPSDTRSVAATHQEINSPEQLPAAAALPSRGLDLRL